MFVPPPSILEYRIYVSTSARRWAGPLASPSRRVTRGEERHTSIVHSSIHRKQSGGVTCANRTGRCTRSLARSRAGIASHSIALYEHVHGVYLQFERTKPETTNKNKTCCAPTAAATTTKCFCFVYFFHVLSTAVLLRPKRPKSTYSYLARTECTTRLTSFLRVSTMDLRLNR